MLRATAAFFSAYWQMILTYRGMMLIQAFRLLFLPIVLLSAWLSIEKTQSNPYENADYLFYYLMVPLILNVTDARAVFKFADAVKDGSLSRDLLKPYPPALLYVIEAATGNLMQMIYLVPITITALYLFRSQLPAINQDFSVLLYFSFALLCGFFMRLIVSGSIAVLGFWVEDVTTLNLVLNGGIWALLGGMIVPVATFPDSIREIAGLLPYRYMLSFPIEILSGHLNHSQITGGFLVIFFWTAFFLVVISRLWKRGLRSFTAYGG